MARSAHRRRPEGLGFRGRRGREAARNRSDQVAENLRPLDILRAAFGTYRKEFWRVAISAVIVFGGFGAVELEVDLAVSDAWGLNIGKLALALILVAFGAAGTVFYPGLLDRVVGVERGHNERQSMVTVLATLPYGRLILAEIILFSVTTIGLALFVVPGLVAFTFFGLVGPTITIENRSAIGAFRRSARLVRPHFWLVFLLVTVPIGFEHLVEGLVHHGVAHEAFLVRFGSHALIGIIVGSIVGLVEVHLAFRLSGRYAAEASPRVTRRQRATRRPRH